MNPQAMSSIGLRLAPALCLVMMTAAPSQAVAPQIGILNCDVSRGIGEILVRNQTMTCQFKQNGGQTESYTGTIHQVGLEIGKVQKGHLIWGVLALVQNIAPGALAGKYVGVSAEAAVGIGAGANALVGGTGQAFSLQPLSVEGEVGLNVAAGVLSVTLHTSN